MVMLGAILVGTIVYGFGLFAFGYETWLSFKALKRPFNFRIIDLMALSFGLAPTIAALAGWITFVQNYGVQTENLLGLALIAVMAAFQLAAAAMCIAGIELGGSNPGALHRFAWIAAGSLMGVFVFGLCSIVALLIAKIFQIW
jgi:hypothetical protein